MRQIGQSFSTRSKRGVHLSNSTDRFFVSLGEPKNLHPPLGAPWSLLPTPYPFRPSPPQSLYPYCASLTYPPLAPPTLLNTLYLTLLKSTYLSPFPFPHSLTHPIHIHNPPSSFNQPYLPNLLPPLFPSPLSLPNPNLTLYNRPYPPLNPLPPSLRPDPENNPFGICNIRSTRNK